MDKFVHRLKQPCDSCVLRNKSADEKNVFSNGTSFGHDIGVCACMKFDEPVFEDLFYLVWLPERSKAVRMDLQAPIQHHCMSVLGDIKFGNFEAMTSDRR